MPRDHERIYPACRSSGPALPRHRLALRPYLRSGTGTWRRHWQNWQTQRGVTLIELIATLVILTILLTLGAGNMGRLIADNRVVSATNSLAGALNYARVEAVFRGNDVAVCAVDPDNLPASGDPCKAGSADHWHQGYAVYLRNSGEILRLQRAEGAVTISANRPRFTFKPDGSARGSNGHARICDARAGGGTQSNQTKPRAVIVSQVGRVRIANQVSGNAIDCPKATDYS
ncbi:MAG: prepilin-type N-terminal cleavage/methylation domain-containing protein [Chromatiaceae bacterium]|nr:MAG: prepilin-type N-terminal cleavage/methylation domain-containing protein [Chromatiaceae bacterium]